MYRTIHTTERKVVTVEESMLVPEVIVRAWKDTRTPSSEGGILADLRLSPEQATALATALLLAADAAKVPA